MNKRREIALRLFGLSVADRRWILRRLPKGDAREFGTLVRELESLGFTPELVNEAVGAEPLAELAGNGAINARRHPDIDTVVRVLAQEPREVACAVLDVADESLKKAVRKRLRIGDGAGHAPTPFVRQCLVECFDNLVDGLPVQAGRPRPWSFLRR